MIITMRFNQEEIPSVSDTSPMTKTQKKANSKRPLSALLDNVPPCANYSPMHVHERDARLNLSAHVNPNVPVELYNLFITL